MLVELAIRDFAIIDASTIPFGEGLNALTGETGAGKSILIDALGAVLGDRVTADVVRTGAKAARIEATFALGTLPERAGVARLLDELGIEAEDDTLILSREIGATGRSSARVNNRAVTAGALARLGASLVDIHGQSDHLSLLRPAEHLEMLDRFAGLGGQRQVVADLVGQWRETRAAIDRIVRDARGRAQRADLLRFQVEEIGGANLRPGEDEELATERTVLLNAEKLALDAAAAYDLLAAGDEADARLGLPALPAIRRAAQRVAAVAAIDDKAVPLAARLDEVAYLLEDAVAEVRDYRDGVEADPARLEAVEERLAEIKALKRKYGATVEEVIRFGEEAARELASDEGAAGDVEALREREADLRRRIGEAASVLSVARRAAADRLCRAVEQAIAELNMGRASFAVAIEQVPDPDGVAVRDDDGRERSVAVGPTGVDKVEFLLAPNAGEALKPLARVASGGETARLMLALKSILSAADQTPTLVFDEVDVGVGGRSAQVVGDKLRALAADHQVIVITHLPQIAAFASVHFRIAKQECHGRVVSTVDEIEGDERVDELAAMLDGVPVTEAARANARAMLARAADRAPLPESSAVVGRR